MKSEQIKEEVQEEVVTEAETAPAAILSGNIWV